jgi:hypothetical protein
MKNKFLLVINGETYRHGHQGSRERGSEESYKLQGFATKSHLDFIKFISNKFNIKSDVLLYYYKLNDVWDLQFVKSYEPHLKYSVSLENLLGETNLHSSLIDYIKNNIDINDYKFILFIRPDLYLKKYFLDIFDVQDEKIKFAYVNEITNHLGKSWHEESGFPSVNHQIFYVPSKFYSELFSGCVWRNHHSYVFSLDCGLKKEQIDFFIKTYHSSSTSNTWNPIFHQVGREETKFWVDKNFVVDDVTHTPKTVEYDNRYDNLTNNDFTENYHE